MYYRLYFMSRASGHIERFEEFEAANDVEAVRIARRNPGQQPRELWQEQRKVERFEVGVPVFEPRRALSG